MVFIGLGKKARLSKWRGVEKYTGRVPNGEIVVNCVEFIEFIVYRMCEGGKEGR